jgi:hypothetical protein
MLYVDDLLVIAASIDVVNELKQALAEEFSMKDLGAASYYLGIRIVRSKGSISLVQDAYTRRLLKKAGMSQCKAAATPMEHHLHQQIPDPDAAIAQDPE